MFLNTFLNLTEFLINEFPKFFATADWPWNGVDPRPSAELSRNYQPPIHWADAGNNQITQIKHVTTRTPPRRRPSAPLTQEVVI